MKALLLAVVLTGCASSNVAVNTPAGSVDLPKPNLIFERELKYVPTTQLRPRITSGANNPPAINFTTDSEYWKGN